MIGLAILASSFLIKSSLDTAGQYEFKQEGPVFLRFNKTKGDLCFTGIAPGGKFATDSWVCLQGDIVKDGEVIPNGLQTPSEETGKTKVTKESNGAKK